MSQNHLTEYLKILSYNTSYVLDKMLADNTNEIIVKNPIFDNGQLTNLKSTSTIDYSKINRRIHHEKNIVRSPSFRLAVNVLKEELKSMANVNKLCGGTTIDELAKEKVCNFIAEYASERHEGKSGAFFRSNKRFQAHITSELSCFIYITPLYNVGGDFSEIRLSKTTRIRSITDKEYVRIVDTNRSLKEIELYQKRLRFVIEYCADSKATHPLDDAKDEYALVTNLIRLSRKGAPEFGQIYLLGSLRLNVLGVRKLELYESTPQKLGAILLSATDRRALVTKYRNVKALLSKGKKSRFLLNSISRFGMACRHRRDSNKIVDYVIALEALLIEGAGESTLKLAHRVAALCGDSDKERLNAWEFIKEVYKFRSGVVHKSSEIQFKINSKALSTTEVSYKLDKITRTAILRMINILSNIESRDNILKIVDRSIYDKSVSQQLQKLWK